jgi:hypothetical protein
MGGMKKEEEGIKHSNGALFADRPTSLGLFSNTTLLVKISSFSLLSAPGARNAAYKPFEMLAQFLKPCYVGTENKRFEEKIPI